MNKEDDYNGFANYETWLVSLWMNNDRACYEHVRELVRQLRDRDEPSTPYMTKAENDRNAIADALRHCFEAGSPVCEHSTLYADLMNAALSEVDWYELAGDLLRELQEVTSDG